MPSYSDPLFYAMLAMVGGPVLFTWGSKKLLTMIAVARTPTSKVRSVTTGRVELSGMARMRKPEQTPISRKPCCWWHCRIQEFGTRGKGRSWVTVKEVQSMDLFYLQDDTGKVLVNPQGADLSIAEQTFELNGPSQSQIRLAFGNWGLSETGWFGSQKKMRVIEQCIPADSTLHVLGELVNSDVHLKDRRARFLEKMRAIKSDPGQMAAADSNLDGTVDAAEWDAFRAKQEEEFLKEESARNASAMEETGKLDKLVRAPSRGPFVVSIKSEQKLLQDLQWHGLLAVAGGIGLTVVGALWAMSLQLKPIYVAAWIGSGLLLGILYKVLASTNLTRK